MSAVAVDIPDQYKKSYPRGTCERRCESRR